MKRSTRRRVELVATCVAGGLIPGAGPILGMRHAERWPMRPFGAGYDGPIKRKRRR